MPLCPDSLTSFHQLDTMAAADRSPPDTLPTTVATAEPPHGWACASIHTGPVQGFSVHKFIRALIAILLALLQANSQANKTSIMRPEVTAAFIVTTSIYFLACYAKEIVKHGKTAQIIEYYSRLLGFLSSVVLLRMLVAVLSWIGLGLWLCCFFAVTCFSYNNIDTQQFLKAIEDPILEMFEALRGDKRDSYTAPNQARNHEEPLNLSQPRCPRPPV